MTFLARMVAAATAVAIPKPFIVNVLMKLLNYCLTGKKPAIPR